MSKVDTGEWRHIATQIPDDLVVFYARLGIARGTSRSEALRHALTSFAAEHPLGKAS